MTKKDMILCEVVSTLRNPDENVKLTRKFHPIRWTWGMILFTVVGVLQIVLWALTIIPAKINKWVSDWRYI